MTGARWQVTRSDLVLGHGAHAVPADSKQVVVTVKRDVPENTSLYAASYISAGTGQPRALGGTLKQAVSRLIDATAWCCAGGGQ